TLRRSSSATITGRPRAQTGRSGSHGPIHGMGPPAPPSTPSERAVPSRTSMICVLQTSGTQTSSWVILFHESRGRRTRAPERETGDREHRAVHQSPTQRAKLGSAVVEADESV